MTVEIKANEIKNETIAKLTRDEIGKLGLLNIGVYTYKGTLKCRVKGLKTTVKLMKSSSLKTTMFVGKQLRLLLLVTKLNMRFVATIK